MATDSNNTCRVCSQESRYLFTLRLLGHHHVQYFDCQSCGYLQTERPYWLDEAYSSAINDVDTGIFQRNLLNVRRVVMTLAVYRSLHGIVLDYAGGYGILVRLLRDTGVEAFWQDKYCENLHARGFEATGSDHDLLTAFEVFEHLEQPLNDLQQMLKCAPAVLLSTELITQEAPPEKNWWYFGTEHGQHIGFFRTRTLKVMADRLGCHHMTDGVSLHIFSREPVPWHWPILMRMQRLAPRVARLALKSKTMSDFELLRSGRT